MALAKQHSSAHLKSKGFQVSLKALLIQYIICSHHDATEIMLKVALNTNQSINKSIKLKLDFYRSEAKLIQRYVIF